MTWIARFSGVLMRGVIAGTSLIPGEITDFILFSVDKNTDTASVRDMIFDGVGVLP